MEFFDTIFEWVIHLDKHLLQLVEIFGSWSYFILFLVIFLETGLVIFPFLPGDGLLFAVGIFSRTGVLDWNIWISSVILVLGAILGNTVNYFLSYYLGGYIQNKLKSERWDRNIRKTHDFFEKYGGSSLIIARFVPIARTYGPFVAGMTKMNYWKFQLYNIIGAVLWVGLCVGLGYGLGNLTNPHYQLLLLFGLATAVAILPAGLQIAYVKWKARRDALNS